MDMENEELNDEQLAALEPVVPKRKPGRPRKQFAVSATAPIQNQPQRQSADVWDSSKPVYGEIHRIIEIMRPYEEHVRGNFVIREGTDLDRMVDQIFDGRKRTTNNLLKLYKFMRLKWENGVACMISQPLYELVTKILHTEGAIEAEPPAPPILGNIFENVIDKLYPKKDPQENTNVRTN